MYLKGATGLYKPQDGAFSGFFNISCRLQVRDNIFKISRKIVTIFSQNLAYMYIIHFVIRLTKNYFRKLFDYAPFRKKIL